MASTSPVYLVPDVSSFYSRIAKRRLRKLSVDCQKYALQVGCRPVDELEVHPDVEVADNLTPALDTNVALASEGHFESTVLLRNGGRWIPGGVGKLGPQPWGEEVVVEIVVGGTNSCNRRGYGQNKKSADQQHREANNQIFAHHQSPIDARSLLTIPIRLVRKPPEVAP